MLTECRIVHAYDLQPEGINDKATPPGIKPCWICCAADFMRTKRIARAAARRSQPPRPRHFGSSPAGLQARDPKADPHRLSTIRPKGRILKRGLKDLAANT
jgi:hypothetical protein